MTTAEEKLFTAPLLLSKRGEGILEELSNTFPLNKDRTTSHAQLRLLAICLYVSASDAVTPEYVVQTINTKEGGVVELPYTMRDVLSSTADGIGVRDPEEILQSAFTHKITRKAFSALLDWGLLRCREYKTTLGKIGWLNEKEKGPFREFAEMVLSDGADPRMPVLDINKIIYEAQQAGDRLYKKTN